MNVCFLCLTVCTSFSCPIFHSCVSDTSISLHILSTVWSVSFRSQPVLFSTSLINYIFTLPISHTLALCLGSVKKKPHSQVISLISKLCLSCKTFFKGWINISNFGLIFNPCPSKTFTHQWRPQLNTNSEIIPCKLFTFASWTFRWFFVNENIHFYFPSRNITFVNICEMIFFYNCIYFSNNEFWNSNIIDSQTYFHTVRYDSDFAFFKSLKVIVFLIWLTFFNM